MYDVEKKSAAISQRITRLIDQFAPGVWDWERASNTFTVTERLRQIFGFPLNHAVDLESIFALMHADDRAWVASIRDQADVLLADPMVVRFRIHRHDNGELRWISSRIWSHDQTDASTPAGYTGTVVDVTEEMATAAALAQSEQRLRLAIEAGKMAVWEVDLETTAVTQSPELNVLFGYPPETFMTLAMARACYNPGELERLAVERHTAEAVRDRAADGAYEPRKSGALSSGDDRTQVQAEVAITARDGKPKRLMLRAQYAVSPEGKPRLTGLLFDITETKLAEERSVMVARELQHRVKNSIAVIGALAAQSFRAKADVESGLRNFMGRLSALAAANDLILSGDTATADLRTLAKKITQPYQAGSDTRFAFEGPELRLQPHSATAAGMVLHELCTNAVKYGALSLPGGQVSIRWVNLAPDTLQMTWEERYGPPVTAPQRRGFGFRLLENVIKADLNGTLALDFKPLGLVCRIEMSISR